MSLAMAHYGLWLGEPGALVRESKRFALANQAIWLGELKEKKPWPQTRAATGEKKPPSGLEPETYRLRSDCSAN
jgi:hypothetical protein